MPRPKRQTVTQMRRTIAKRPQGSVWAQVRKTPQIKRTEMSWITRRNRPGELIPVGKDRGAHGVNHTPRHSARSYVHTHPINGSHEYSIASELDLRTFLRDIHRPGIRTWHIISVSMKTGNPTGLYVLHAHPRFVRWVRKYPKKVAELRRLLNKLYLEKPSNSRLLNLAEVREFLEKRGLKIRIRSRPGYSFNGQVFVHARKKPTKK